MSRFGWDRDWPPKAKPRRAADGIKARSKRGAFATGWWAKRWIAKLQDFELGARLTRGRSYARSGQVTQIVLELGGVRAQVQGSRAKPYDVTIRIRQLLAADWGSVAAAIAGDARLSAALLAGHMPEDIETAFEAAGVSLFPANANEMKTVCSCPDWSNPCKHIAAVFYLVGEEFDRDPFLLFVVRGLARDAVRELFGATDEPIVQDAGVSSTRKPARRGRAAEATPLDATFWGGDVAVSTTSSRIAIAASSEAPAVLERAGNFPFWRGEVALGEAIVPIYTGAAAAALEWLADRAERRQGSE